jgi:hypothetical protein
MDDDIQWNDEKNEQLKARFGFGFEKILVALSEGGFIDERAHPNTQVYGHQRQLVVKIDDYIWIVPFVTDGEVKFFKTFFPSRDATKNYLGIAQ